MAYGRPKAMHNEHGLAATRHLRSKSKLCELTTGLRTLVQFEENLHVANSLVNYAVRSTNVTHGIIRPSNSMKLRCARTA